MGAPTGVGPCVEHTPDVTFSSQLTMLALGMYITAQLPSVRGALPMRRNSPTLSTQGYMWRSDCLFAVLQMPGDPRPSGGVSSG